MSFSKLFNSTDKRHRLSLRLNAWSESLSLKVNYIINAETAVPIKYLNIFWRTLKMCLINCKMNLILICSSTCVIAGVNRETSFPVTDTKLI